MVRQSVCCILAVGVLSCLFVGQVEAQNSFRRHRTLRWLGQGFSDGYHRCTPGYDSSHYNPYSQHNSFLYSQSQAYQKLNGTQNYIMNPGRNPQFFTGVPFSIYAAPPSMNLPQPTPRGNTAPRTRETEPIQEDDDLDVTFEPATPNFFDRNGTGLVKETPEPESPWKRPEAQPASPVATPDVPNSVPVNSETKEADRFDGEEPNDDEAADETLESTFRLPVLNGSGIDPVKVQPFRQTGYRKK